jgi:hypothetical protein
MNNLSLNFPDMKINKEELWPKTGKLKKTLIILAIVITGSLGIVLLEEQTSIKLSKRIPVVIAFACIGVWLYNPAKKEKA